MSLESWGKEVEERPGRFVAKVILVVIGLVTLFAALSFTCNPLKQAGRIVNKTIDADNVLYNYEWFKQRHQDIQAVDAKVKSAGATVAALKTELGPRSEWKREDREEAARLSAVHLGLRQQRNDLAAEYNARSQMANRAIFRTGELPERVSIEGE